MNKKTKQIVAVIGVLVLVFLFIWANLKRTSSQCKGLVVEIENDNQLVTQKLIRKTVNIAIGEGEPEGVKLSKINLNKIEKALDSLPQIRKAHVFMDMYSKMNIRVLPQQPIMRVHNRKGLQYYVTKDSSIIKTFVNTVVDVPVATGFIRQDFTVGQRINSPLMTDLINLARVINKDRLLKSQIEQIYVNDGGEINLIPLVGSHIIVFGNCDNLENKIDRLKQFYQKGLNKVGWRKYKQIILKYDKQVICK